YPWRRHERILAGGAVVRAVAALPPARHPPDRAYEAVHMAYAGRGEGGVRGRWVVLWDRVAHSALRDAVVVELDARDGSLITIPKPVNWRAVSRPPKLTPMLEQYFDIKREVPDAILFYRLGDFYEMFYEDAEKAAPLLDLVLTARGKGQEHEAPMCGVPYHAADAYIAKLIRHGLRVAICEQVEDPATAKGLVRREIVRVVTPGTATESAIVERDSYYLLSLVPNGTSIGAAYLDVSTGDFFVTTYGDAADTRLGDDVARFAPREAIVPRESAFQLAIPM